MKSQHPLAPSSYIFITRHANGVSISVDGPNTSRVDTPGRTHVFTTFKDFTEFMRGWWPEGEGK